MTNFDSRRGLIWSMYSRSFLSETIMRQNQTFFYPPSSLMGAPHVILEAVDQFEGHFRSQQGRLPW